MKRIFTIPLLLLISNFATGQSLQGGLENWRNYTSTNSPQLEAPISWFGIDSLVYYVTDQFPGVATPERMLFETTTTVHSGSSAARIMSRSLGPFVGVIPGVLVNADPALDMSTFDPMDPFASLSYNGGTAVSARVNSVSAWIKYEPKGTDTASVIVMAVMNNASTNNADSVIGEGFYSTTASMSGYQQVTVPVSYTNGVDVPTKVVIAFVSGSTSGGGDSSTLYVDDVSFSTVGVNDLASAASVVKTYPNPAGNTLHLETAIEGNMVWEAFDMQGRKLKTETFSGKKTLDISALAPGLYGYRISSPDGKSLQAGVFSVSR